MPKNKKTPKTRSIVINCCYGGFNLSADGLAMLAELRGQKCYFFQSYWGSKEDGYTPVSLEEARTMLSVCAFSVPNPAEIIKRVKKWQNMSDDEKRAENERYESIYIDGRNLKRDDPNLVKIVKTLGEKSWGEYAKLSVVEIPADVEWEISEYDGMERVEEVHRSWP